VPAFATRSFSQRISKSSLQFFFRVSEMKTGDTQKRWCRAMREKPST
jgi:peroxiredoxin